MGTPFRRLDNYPLRAHTYFYAAIPDERRVQPSGRNSVVECLLPKQNVVGSIPIARSMFFLGSRSTLSSSMSRSAAFRPAISSMTTMVGPGISEMALLRPCLVFVVPRRL